MSLICNTEGSHVLQGSSSHIKEGTKTGHTMLSDVRMVITLGGRVTRRMCRGGQSVTCFLMPVIIKMGVFPVCDFIDGTL